MSQVTQKAAGCLWGSDLLPSSLEDSFSFLTDHSVFSLLSEDCWVLYKRSRGIFKNSSKPLKQADIIFPAMVGTDLKAVQPNSTILLLDTTLGTCEGLGIVDTKINKPLLSRNSSSVGVAAVQRVSKFMGNATREICTGHYRPQRKGHPSNPGRVRQGRAEW